MLMKLGMRFLYGLGSTETTSSRAHSAALMTEGSCKRRPMITCHPQNAEFDTRSASFADHICFNFFVPARMLPMMREMTIISYSHLVTESLSVVLVQVSTSQGTFMVRIQLLEAMQRHDSFLSHQLLGVACEPSHSWQHGIDKVRANQLRRCRQCCADCRQPQHFDSQCCVLRRWATWEIWEIICLCLPMR